MKPGIMKLMCGSSSGSKIVESCIDTPIGTLIIACCDSGIHSVSHQEKVNDENFTPNEQAKLSITTKAVGSENGLVTKKAMIWLQNYFSGSWTASVEKAREPPDIPSFCLPEDESTEFERLVWLTLFEKTNVGDTVSYKQLAQMIGKPNAARAVGTALKKNPIPIIIPCHRVIKSSGALGNYSGGTKNKMKEFLLEQEKKLPI